MDSKRILIIQTAFIGDVILATSLLETVYKAFPTAKIDFLLRQGNEGLLENHPFVHRTWVWKKKESKYGSLWKLLKAFRKEKFDIVINLQRFGATGILTGFSKAPIRVGFVKNPFSFLFTHTAPHEIGSGLHEIHRNHRLLAPLTTVVCQAPRLYPSTADRQQVAAMQTAPYVCIAPSSVWFTKQYTEAGWVDLIDRLDAPTQVYLLGGPTDQALTERIRQRCLSTDRVTNLSGKLTFLQSAALMQQATMNYVNDSAPLHICSATDAAVKAIFCSTVPEFGFGPLSPQAKVIQTPQTLACRPCGLHGHKACPEGHFKCATSISTEQLLES
ncbi:heptosyltransferase-2 [Dyadobacter jejuensis]|uniref:Heptosyltransferase-2 n=1 Tax=Dyadobacter jejuensis TaxID=1082580 RepID=A0A316B3K5_9BACT|nr:glycosyltransferase family 9 protein [Dyadobacter jejuensis]PWJ57147.1 heptosyltransferase-2 [Dyadobacter jejuensis]